MPRRNTGAQQWPTAAGELTCALEMDSLLQWRGTPLPGAVCVDLLFRILPNQRLPDSGGVVILHKMHILETAHKTLSDYACGSWQTKYVFWKMLCKQLILCAIKIKELGNHFLPVSCKLLNDSCKCHTTTYAKWLTEYLALVQTHHICRKRCYGKNPWFDSISKNTDFWTNQEISSATGLINERAITF